MKRNAREKNRLEGEEERKCRCIYIHKKRRKKRKTGEARWRRVTPSPPLPPYFLLAERPPPKILEFGYHPSAGAVGTATHVRVSLTHFISPVY